MTDLLGETGPEARPYRPPERAARALHADPIRWRVAWDADGFGYDTGTEQLQFHVPGARSPPALMLARPARAPATCAPAQAPAALVAADPRDRSASVRVGRGGVEPPTSRFSGERSYRLSYLPLPVSPPESDPDGTRTRDLRRDRAAR